jgi:hypothetical protein
MPRSVLALDLASVTGWACGEPGATPAHGSIRFASQGASHEAIFASAFRWMNSILLEFGPKLVVWESPLAGFKTGSTTNNATTILFGLPAVIGTATYLRGGYDIRKADTAMCGFISSAAIRSARWRSRLRCASRQRG